MNGKTIGMILGAVGALLWFMPLAYVEFMGQEGYQAGNHIGGIAYVLLFTSAVYGWVSWTGQHVPRIVAAAVGLAICLLFLVQAGSSAAWGLWILTVVNVASIALAVRDNKAATPENAA